MVISSEFNMRQYRDAPHVIYFRKFLPLKYFEKCKKTQNPLKIDYLNEPYGDGPIKAQQCGRKMTIFINFNNWKMWDSENVKIEVGSRV